MLTPLASPSPTLHLEVFLVHSYMWNELKKPCPKRRPIELSVSILFILAEVFPKIEFTVVSWEMTQENAVKLQKASNIVIQRH